MGVVQFNYDQEAQAAAAVSGGGRSPEGIYTLEVTELTWDPPKAEGQYPRLITKSKILESFNQLNIGKVRTRRFSMSPKAIPYFLERFFKAAGIPYTMNGGVLQFDDAHLFGARTKVTCEHNKGNDGNTYEDWINDEPVVQQAAQAAPAPSPFVPGQAPAAAPFPQPGAPQPQPQPAPGGYAPQPAAPAALPQQAPTAAPFPQPAAAAQQPAWQPPQAAPPAQQQQQAPFAPQQPVAGAPQAWPPQGQLPQGPPAGPPVGAAPYVPPRGQG